MTEIELNKTAISSFVTTLKDEGSVEASTTISAGTSIGVGSSITRTITIARPAQEVDGIHRVRVQDSNYSAITDRWLPLTGDIRITSPDGVSSGSYLYTITIYYTATDINYQFVLTNNTGGSVSLPAITLTGHTRFFSAPW